MGGPAGGNFAGPGAPGAPGAASAGGTGNRQFDSEYANLMAELGETAAAALVVLLLLEAHQVRMACNRQQ